jgi:hypothetical protein
LLVLIATPVKKIKRWPQEYNSKERKLWHLNINIFVKILTIKKKRKKEREQLDWLNNNGQF